MLQSVAIPNQKRKFIMREQEIFTVKQSDNSGEEALYHFYPSVQDLIKTEVEPKSLDNFMSSTYQREFGAGKDWFGVEDAAAVDEALSKGWPEGTKKMRDALGQIELPQIPSIRRKKKWSDSGDEVCIHRVNSGRIDRAWRKSHRVSKLAQTGSHVTIAVDCCASATVTADKCMWRGAAACAIAEAAIASGRSVRMVVTLGAQNSLASKAFKEHHIAVEVKSYTQNVDIDVLMTMASLPGFFRVHGFRAFSSVYNIRTKGTFGQPVDFERQMLADGSKMIWISKDTLSDKKAIKAANHAAIAMVNRVDADEYIKS